MIVPPSSRWRSSPLPVPYRASPFGRSTPTRSDGPWAGRSSFNPRFRENVFVDISLTLDTKSRQ